MKQNRDCKKSLMSFSKTNHPLWDINISNMKKIIYFNSIKVRLERKYQVQGKEYLRISIP